MAELEYEGVFTYVDGDGNTTKLYPDVKTDKTLLVPEKAADADSVGEAFSDTVAWNLIPYPYIQTTYTKNGIVWTDNGNGTVTANGTNTGASNTVSTFKLAYCSAADDKKLYLEPGEYTMYGCPAGGGTSTWRIRFGGGTSATFIGHDFGDGCTFTLTERTLFDADLQVYGGVTVNNLVFKPMLVKGSHPRKLESSYQYLHGLLGTVGGGNADGIRYVNDESDPNCYWVQIQNENGEWVNWERGNLDANWLVKDGENLANFHYTGVNTATSEITNGSVLRLSATTTIAGETTNMSFDTDLIDLTNCSKLVYSHSTTLQGGEVTNASIQIVNSSGNVVYTQTYLKLTKATNTAYTTETQEGTLHISLANINGNNRIRVVFHAYGQNTTQIANITSCYLE